MKLIGCLLVPIFLLIYCVIEGFALYYGAKTIGLAFEGWHHPEWLTALGVMTVNCIIGVVIVKRQIAAIPTELMGAMLGTPGKGLGRRMVTILAGILLAIPGFASDAVGLLLLLPPVQMLLSAIATRIALSVVRQQASKMMAGGAFSGGAFSGFAGFGGNAGAGAHPFSGKGPMLGALKPDDAVRRPKVYDVKAEKD